MVSEPPAVPGTRAQCWSPLGNGKTSVMALSPLMSKANVLSSSRGAVAVATCTTLPTTLGFTEYGTRTRTAIISETTCAPLRCGAREPTNRQLRLKVHQAWIHRRQELGRHLCHQPRDLRRQKHLPQDHLELARLTTIQQAQVIMHQTNRLPQAPHQLQLMQQQKQTQLVSSYFLWCSSL